MDRISVSLNVLLADAFALYLKTKNFHWHVSGRHFRDYHLMLDEQSDAIFATTDQLAERVRKLGSATLRSIGQIGKLQTIKDNNESFVPPREMLRVHAPPRKMNRWILPLGVFGSAATKSISRG